VAALPFHYYLALREDWIESQAVAPAEDDDGFAGLEGFDLNAKSLKGEAV